VFDDASLLGQARSITLSRLTNHLKNKQSSIVIPKVLTQQHEHQTLILLQKICSKRASAVVESSFAELQYKV
jgi:hypothetical protein